jgi:hypothetical protein
MSIPCRVYVGIDVMIDLTDGLEASKSRSQTSRAAPAKTGAARFDR